VSAKIDRLLSLSKLLRGGVLIVIFLYLWKIKLFRSNISYLCKIFTRRGVNLYQVKNTKPM
jgi:hypothetical protein